MSRYNRHIILSDVGAKGQQLISKAKVLVVGAGGLGCPVLQYLTAAGVGQIGIIDFDIVETSNLQRQILFGTASLGKNKALAAKERLKDLNPTIHIEAYPKMLSPKNAITLFEEYDIVVDGTDNFETRYLVNDASVITKTPVVYGAIYKFEGQVSVFNYNNGPSYRCLFPKAPAKGTVPNCSEIGVLGVLPGIIGSMQANEVIKIILGFKGVLSGKLLCYDAKSANSYMLKIQRNEAEIARVRAAKKSFELLAFDLNCESDLEISISQLGQFNNVVFIDVREDHEQPKLILDNVICIPLKQFEERLEEIPKNKSIIVFCQSGVRSKDAVSQLRKHQITNSFSLKEGVFALTNQHIES